MSCLPTYKGKRYNSLEEIKNSLNKPKNNSLSSLDGKVEKFLTTAGISLEVVDEIKNRFGQSPVAVLDFFHKTLKVANRTMDSTTLPEEAGHVYMKILEQRNPFLYDRMLKDVQTKHRDILTEVEKEYGEVYETIFDEFGEVVKSKEKQLLEEAAGKVIGKYLIKQTEKADISTLTWWEKVKDVLKGIFNLEQFEDLFSIAAKNIISGKNVHTVMSSNQVMYQLSNQWSSIKSNLLSVHDSITKKNVIDKEGAVRERYFIDGTTEVKNRGTELIKDAYTYIERTTKEKISDEKKAALGTAMHEAMSNAVTRYLNPKTPKYTNPLIPDVILGHVDTYIKSLLSEFKDAEIFTELQVYDKSKDLASTIDLLILDAKGYAHIFDFKFITANITEDGYKHKIYVPYGKKEVWNKQLGTYKKILKDVYGIEKFGKQRILPFEVAYDKDSNPLKVFIDGVSVYEQALPSKEERTGSLGVDRLIDKLEEEYIALNENKSISYEDKNYKLAAIENSINELKVSNSVDKFIGMANAELSIISKTIESSDEITQSSLKNMLSKYELYTTALDLKYNESLKSYDRLKELEENLDAMHKQLYGYDNKEGEHVRGKLDIWQETNGIKYEYFKGIGFMGSLTATLGQYNNPLVQKLYRTITNAKDKVYEETEKIRKKMKSLMEEIDSFDSILHKDKDGKYDGTTIRKYKSDFYNSLEGSNSKWVKENTILRETVKVGGVEINSKEHFKAVLKQRSEYYNKIDPSSADKAIDAYRRKNDFWDEKYKNSAYLNYARSRGKNKYLEPAKQWKTDEYNNILNNPDSAISQFYMMIQDLIYEANQLSNDRISTNFIPSIEKSMLKLILEGNVQGIKDASMSNLTMRDYELSDMNNPKLKLKHTYELGESKSLDLGEVFLLFAESVNNVKYLSAEQDSLYLMKKTLESGEIVQTDAVGKPIFKNDKIETISAIKEKETIEAFERLVRVNFFDYRDESDVEIGGKSGAKIGDNAIKYMSGVKMFSNVFSATANFFGGNANLWIKAIGGGRLFNSSELAVANGRFYTGDAKARALASYFDITTLNDVTRKSRTLKLDTLDTIGKSDFVYWMQQGGDFAVQQTTLQAILESHTLKEGKLLRKQKGDTSLYDLSSIENGEITIPSLTKEQFNLLRRRVQGINKQIMGAMSSEHKLAAKATFVGRALTHFKTWALPMGKDRFGALHYDSDTGLYEEGRFNQVFKILISKQFVPAIKNLLLFNLDGVVNSTEAALQSRYNTYMELNPNLKYNEVTGEGLSFEEYKIMFKANIKAVLAELAIAAGTISAFMAAKPDEDDEKTATRNLISKVLWRSANEMTYWISVDSYLEMGGMQLPLVGLLKDVMDVFKYTSKEAYYAAVGDTESLEKNKVGKHIADVVPIWNTWDNLTNEIFE